MWWAIGRERVIFRSPSGQTTLSFFSPYTFQGQIYFQSASHSSIVQIIKLHKFFFLHSKQAFRKIGSQVLEINGFSQQGRQFSDVTINREIHKM